jgi:hypothetical protein
MSALLHVLNCLQVFENIQQRLPKEECSVRPSQFFKVVSIPKHLSFEGNSHPRKGENAIKKIRIVLTSLDEA